MASVSFNKKGIRIYAKFSDPGFPAVHLGKNKADSIRFLKGVFNQRQYIENGIYTQEKLDQLIERINENMKW